MIIRSIGDLIEGRTLYTVARRDTVQELCRRLHHHHVGALAVLDGGALVGIVSERDVVSRVIAPGREAAGTLVEDVMTPDPHTIDVEECLADALQRMLDGHFRHLPVMREGQVVGMISMRDIPTEYRLMHQRFREALVAPVVV